MARIRYALVAAAVLAALPFATAHAGPPGSTVLLTRPAGFGPLTPATVNDSISDTFSGNASFYNESHAGRRLAGGPSNTTRYTVFVSRSDGLASDDNDTVDNIYVRDAVNETTTLVSRATDGTPANGNSGEPAISADGRYVVFTSRATNLVPNVDPNGTTQIYRRDLQNGVTTLISRANGSAGAVGDSSSHEPSVSEDGSVIAFSSQATNLGDPSGASQVYVRAGSSTLIASIKNGTTTTPATGNSFGPSVSDDGDFVAFTTAAGDVGASDNNGKLDVFRFNVNTTAMAHVSVSSINPGAYGNGDSSGASISSDGHRVAFASDATNFAALDAGTDRDVYVHDFGSGATFLASQGGGAKANASSADASISGDGVKIAFTTNATNLSGADTNGYSDVYVRDTSMLGGTTLASRCQGGALLTLPAVQGAIAPTGTRVSFTTATVGCTPQADPDFVQVFSRGLGLAPVGVELTSWISRPSGSGDFKSGTNHSALHGFFRSTDTPSALSADGSVAAFVSEADEMSPDDHDRVPNVFVRDARTGATELMSRASGVDGAAGNGPSGPNLFGGGLALSGSVTTPPSISDDGRYVAFTSLADNLVPNDNNGRSDVFVRDRVTQTTTLVSVGSDEAQINESSYDSDISADGTRIAFTSKARFDQAVDLTTAPSVYVRDLAAGTTTLVSRQNGANGASANDDADAPAISGDGKRVVFETAATNLAPSLIDNNSVGDVYMRDLGTDATSIVSIRNGLPSAGNHGGGSADIDANGTHVAFASSSDNLVGAGDANGASDVFVRTIGTPDVVLVSKGPGGAAGNGFSIGPSISADGTRVAFSTGATDLFSGDTNQAIDVLLRDLTAGTTTLVSRADGADGALPNATSEYATISADGHCVAFDSQAGNLVAGLSGTDFIHGYLRAIDADCGTPPPGSPPPGPAPGPAPDTTAPVLSGLKLTPATFRLGAKPTAVSTAKTPPKGTKIRFTLSEAASVSLRIERKTKGHRKGRKCVAKRKTGKRCTRYVLKGTLKRSGKAGVNSVAFSGRIGKRKLAKGRYRVVVRATDAAGNRSAKKTAAFRIV